MNPKLPTGTGSEERRKGFYVSSSRTKLPTHKSNINEVFLKRLSEIEKQIDKDKIQKNITWKYIDRPHESRLSTEPEIYKPYRFSDRAIEKTAFGDHLYLQYLIKRTNDICIVPPEFERAIDSIQLFYDIPKSGIKYSSSILKDWSLVKPLLLSYPELDKRYDDTFDLIDKNLVYFNNALRPKSDGPQLKQNNPEYDRLIYSLVTRIMEGQKVVIDLEAEVPIFMVPNVERLERCLISKKRYIVFFVRLKLKDGFHANMMIMDTNKKTVERFEPQGIDHGFYDNKVLDKIIRDYFKKLGYTYIPPEKLCKLGVQDIIESRAYDYNVSGFCKTWSLLYALLRLILIDEDTPVMENMISMVMKVSEDYFEARRNKKFMKGERDTKDVDFVIEFLYEFIPEIIEEGKEEIQKMNRILGTNLILDGRMIRTKD